MQAAAKSAFVEQGLPVWPGNVKGRKQESADPIKGH